MRKFLIYISNRHEAILKGILIVLAVASITWLLPHKPRYRFDFQIGQMWNNNDLVAPFDFTILKNPDSLRSETERVRDMVPHYYRKDTAVQSAVLQAVFEKISVIPSDDNALLMSTARSVLSDVYQKGLVSREGLTEGDAGKVIVLTGNKGVSVFTGDLYTFEKVSVLCSQSVTALDQERAGFLCGLIQSSLKPDLFYDQAFTEKVREQEASSVLPTHGTVLKGELIVTRGQLVDEHIYQMLSSLKSLTETSRSSGAPLQGLVFGQVLLILVCMTMLLLFLALLRKDIFHDNRKLALLFLVMVLFTALYSRALQIPTISPLLVPLCILPIIIRVFFDTRLALFSHVITVLILGSVAPNGYEFVFMQVVAGMVTIFSVTNMRRRAQLFISAGMIFVAYLGCYLAIAITHEGGIGGVDPMNIAWLGGNILLTLFAYPLIYVFEKIFNLISDISLMELADTNTPLLRELSMKAPGTFQHSMQVANLAEEAVFRIGGNALLVRVGALYHDIGKMEMPLYFIENQVTGVNPHDEISFEESASIIIGHVISGIEIARKNKLPDLVIDFIRTHHGTSMVQYFYQSYLKNFPEEIIDEEAFRYPGPLPFSKETAVLMMADSVEASSRSLPKHDADSINKLVDDIIDRQIEQQQYINSDITFRDISIIKKIFKKMLMSVYHVRVEYPRAVN